MKKLLTKSEMLDLWRLLRADEPLRLDCTLTRTDGVDRSLSLESEMRTWYLTLLDCAPEAMLAPVNMSAKATLTTATGNKLTVISAPDEVRRILSVKFSGWDAPLTPNALLDDVIVHADNPFCRTPMAARQSARTILVNNAVGELSELNCAVDFGEDVYSFDDSALGQLIIKN